MSTAPSRSLRGRDQLQQWGVLALMTLLLIGIVLFVFLILLPDVRRRADYQAVLTDARTELSVAQQGQLEAPARLRSQLATAGERLNDVSGGFLNEAESTIIVNRLYTYAEAAGVDVVNLQAAPAVVSPTHSQRDYRFQVAGEMVSLLQFLGSIREVTLPGFVVNTVSIVPNAAPTASTGDGTNTHTLAMNVAVVSSPYSTRTVLGPAQAPAVRANVGDLPLAEVQRQLELAWVGRDWEQAIALLSQVIAAAPESAAAHIALYRAHVNAGYHHLIARDYAAAASAFEAALAVQPAGVEAAGELQQLVRDSTLSHRVEDELRQALSQARATVNWQETIRLLRIIAAVDPEYGPVGEELTTAYISYGNELAQAGDTVRAEEQYQLAQFPSAGQAPVVSSDNPSAVAIPTPVPPVSVSIAPPTSALSPTAPPVVPTSPAMPTPTPLPTLMPTSMPPVQPTVAAVLPTPAPTNVPSTNSYVVQPGDTLITIAQAHGTTVEVLRAANGLSSNNLVVGQVLFIAQPQSPALGYVEYTVTTNDTIFSLAQRYGTTVEAIMQVNRLQSPSIYVGQQLLIPTPLSMAPDPAVLAAGP